MRLYDIQMIEDVRFADSIKWSFERLKIWWFWFVIWGSLQSNVPCKSLSIEWNSQGMGSRKTVIPVVELLCSIDKQFIAIFKTLELFLKIWIGFVWFSFVWLRANYCSEKFGVLCWQIVTEAMIGKCPWSLNWFRLSIFLFATTSGWSLLLLCIIVLIECTYERKLLSIHDTFNVAAMLA